MIRRLRLHAVRRDEGAILLFALIIITTIALVVGTLLTRGDGSLRATVALRSVAGSSYAADAAANVAINNLRTGAGFTAPAKFDNADPDSGGKGCFGNTITSGDRTDELSLDAFYPATGGVGRSSAYVECTGEDGTGAQGSPVAITDNNKPGQAILTLGTNSTKGLSFGQSASETDLIHGKVTSNLALSSKGTLNVTGSGVTVNARTGCSGTVQINGSVATCGTKTIPDPGYAPPSTSPVLAQAPKCPTSNNGPEIFSPGLYTMTPDKAGVTPETQKITLDNGTSSGTFTPALTGYGAVGPQQYDVAPADLQVALRTAWGIDVTVNGTARSDYSITFPTILGDVTQMTAPSQLGPGNNKSALVSTTTAGSSTCSKTVGWMYFAPSSASSTGIYYFNWAGTWSLSGTAIGGTLSTAKDGTVSAGTTISPGGGASAPTDPGACVNPILDPGAVGIEMAFGGTSQVDMSNTSLKEFCATYSKTSIPTVVYGLKTAVGSVPAQSGCIVSSSPCAMINASNGKQAVFYFEGFVYAPSAFISLNANNVSQPFFNFGLITDSLFVGANPSNKCDGCAFINLPDNSLGYGITNTTVDVKVHVCLDTPTVTQACKTNSPSLTARVQLWDPDGDPARRQITVLSWSHSQ